MGIKHLNHFILNSCNNRAVYRISLSQLAGKRIAVDASIYMYRFQSEERLIEHMYLMLSLLLKHNAIPLFVFDGKAPAEKQDIIKERRERKYQAELQHSLLQIQIEDAPVEQRDKLEKKLQTLKKQFVRIKDTDIKNVQQLLDLFGISWVEAHGEADLLCAQLMYTKRVDACMSEDMDLFAYGCNCVLRHISLYKQNIINYDLKEILTQIGGYNVQEFKQILVLSGTDYNSGGDGDIGLNRALTLFSEYKKSTFMSMEEIPPFYAWMRNHIKLDEAKLMTAYNLFNINNNLNLDFINNIVIENKPINRLHLNEFLENEGFIF